MWQSFQDIVTSFMNGPFGFQFRLYGKARIFRTIKDLLNYTRAEMIEMELREMIFSTGLNSLNYSKSQGYALLSRNKIVPSLTQESILFILFNF